ncbi:PepSY-like domain-containing protein [Paraflavisolibacter sp. H34]|uniref:PepSY-like domain-containing protein n=1 Tax=Huijunlia imazamoxiresistens TaxID=3127457 RepID=UPI003019BD44
MVRLVVFIAFLFFGATSFAQLRTIPVQVEDAFKQKYPAAENVAFKDNLVNVHISFELSGEKLTATYNNKGMWKETEKEWTFEQLPADVKVGFEKSKYAEWKVTETKVLYRPDGKERFRVKVEKSDLQKRNLMFSAEGRLIQEGATL